MTKKNMVLADHDKLYLKQLSNYFMEKAPQLEMNLFTDETLLSEYLEQPRSIDIVAVDDAFAALPELKKVQNAAKIVLSATMAPVDGFETVKKYQKTEALLNEILLKYAECTGCAEAIMGKSHTRTAAFYSPAGGTGKTVLALGMAAACARSGLRTFYLNLEMVDSVKELLGRTPGSLSDIFLALKTKGTNVGVKLAACKGMEPAAGFYYLSGVDSISEYEEITGTDLKGLLDTIKSLAEFDVMILDLNSGFSGKNRMILEQADVVFVPALSDEGTVAKLRRFLSEMDLHDVYNPLIEKMRLVVNRTERSGIGLELQESGILNRMQCSAVIPVLPQLMRKNDVLCSGEILLPVFDPMIQSLGR